MTSDNVLKFLGNREYLHQVSYQELKSMVVQYPYSLSLRYLLAMKSQQEDNTDLGRNVELLSTYGIDRAHLHKVFSEAPIVLEDLEETVVMGEDFLELKELSTLEREIEETQFIKTESNLNFLEESIPTSTNDLSVFSEPPITIPPVIIDTPVAELETILADVPTNQIKVENELSKIVEEPTLILATTPDEIVEEEEEYVELDFEDSTDLVEDIGIPTTLPEVAPSESYSVKEKDFDENGLPSDAIEVNDLFKEGDIGELSLEELFKESEQEAITEEAVSDSLVFIENPSEVLEEESHTALVEEKVEELVEEEEFEPVEENIKKEKEPLEKATIPFEVSYSEVDPTGLEEVDIIDEPTEELVAPTLLEIDEEQAIPAAAAVVKEEVIKVEEVAIVEKISEQIDPIEKVLLPEEKNKVVQISAVFKFDSLDQFELALQGNKIAQFTKPIPKTGFSSWKDKYSGISTFSGINIDPISVHGGKVIKKKKRVVQKKFEKTVAFAEESLKMGTHIVSETLAQLLVKQGQYSRAKTMYEELSLTMPEKSSFFAAEIEKIQNLPDESS